MKPLIVYNIGVEREGRHDIDHVLGKWMRLTGLSTSVMIPNKFFGKWIVFRGDDIGKNDHKDWTLDVNAYTLLYDYINLQRWRAYDAT